MADRRPLRRTAWAPALGGSDDGVGSLAARAIQDLEGSAWALEVPEQAGESGVQRLEPGDPVGDLGSSSRDHAGQLGSGVAAVPGVAPAGDPRRFVEGEIEAAKVDDQAQVLDIGRPVVAVRVVSPTGSR